MPSAAKEKYKCSYCSRSFPRPAALGSHVYRSHPEHRKATAKPVSPAKVKAPTATMPEKQEPVKPAPAPVLEPPAPTVAPAAAPPNPALTHLDAAISGLEKEVEMDKQDLARLEALQRDLGKKQELLAGSLKSVADLLGMNRQIWRRRWQTQLWTGPGGPGNGGGAFPVMTCRDFRGESRSTSFRVADAAEPSRSPRSTSRCTPDCWCEGLFSPGMLPRTADASPPRASGLAMVLANCPMAVTQREFWWTGLAEGPERQIPLAAHFLIKTLTLSETPHAPAICELPSAAALIRLENELSHTSSSSR